jgi:hypothetical protein
MEAELEAVEMADGLASDLARNDPESVHTISDLAAALDALRQGRSYAELGRAARPDRRLGVHAAIDAPGASGPLPVHVERDTDTAAGGVRGPDGPDTQLWDRPV